MARRMGDVDAELAELLEEAWRPPTRLTVSEWADRHRVMTSEVSAREGRWSTDRTPYLREIMDALSVSSPVREVVLMKGAQVGGTEVALNWVGQIIAQNPGPTMIVQPTVELAEVFSKVKLATMIDHAPAVRARVPQAKSRDGDNTTLHKQFPGGFLRLAGANSAAGLRSVSIRYLVLDEEDAYPPNVDDEGDPTALAMQRTVSFGDRRKVLRISTPLVAGVSAIERAYMATDQRRYFVPCLECGEASTLEWEHIRWPEGRPLDAVWACPACGACTEDWRKGEMLARGEWRPTAAAVDPRVRGYHLSALYAPRGFLTWGEIAQEFERAQGDTTRLRAWRNLKLGLPWSDEEVQTFRPGSLLERCEPYGEPVALGAARRVPPGVVLLTAGVDVQLDRLEVEVVGWGVGEESWSVDYQVIRGDTATDRPWKALDELLASGWASEVPGRHPYVIAATAVDSGNQTQTVYAWTKPRAARCIWPTKGAAGPRPVWPAKPKRGRVGNRALVYLVGVDAGKEAVYGRLGIAEPGPGYMHFPMGRTEAYFEQLTAEAKRVLTRRGRPEVQWYLPSGRRNEALDCRVYAYAALQGLVMGGLRLEQVAAREDAEAQAAGRLSAARKWSRDEIRGKRDTPPPARNSEPRAPAPRRTIRPVNWRR